MRPLVLVVLAAACSNEFRLESQQPKPEIPLETDVVVTDEPVTDEPVTDEPDPDEPPPADKPIYANTADTLYSVNPLTGEASLIDQFSLDGAPISGFVDIAIDLTGRLIGGNKGGDGSTAGIYQIDPSTATTRLMCETDADMVAMTFLSDGRLVVGGTESLQYVDIDQGCASSPLFARGAESSFETSGDIVGHPDEILYWTVRGDDHEDDDALARVDPSGMWGAVKVGSIKEGRTGFNRLFGLAYDEGEEALYGFSANGQILRIDPTTGAAVELTRLDLEWWGATTNPVVW